jgi:outer membrane immunogenic protein
VKVEAKSLGAKSIGAKTVGSGALLAAAAAAASSNPALAGDLARPRDPVAAAPSWQGFYVGASVGASWLTSAIDDTAISPVGYGAATGGSRSTANAPGWLGGLQAGYNWQDRNFVYGLEADVSFLGNAKASTNGNVTSTAHFGPFTYGYNANATRTSKVNGVATFRARFGFDFNGTMPYVTAGLALGDVKNTYAMTSGYGSSTMSKTSFLPGVAFGGGVEHQFTDSRWTLRAEMLWVGFQDKTLPVTSVFGYGSAGNVRFSNNILMGKVGMNYRF